MKRLFSIILLLLISSCLPPSKYQFIEGDGLQYESNGYTIIHKVRNMKYGTGSFVSIEYKDYSVLYKETSDKLDNKLADAKTRESELNDIPQGGMIIIEINRPTIGLANTNNFEYVVVKNGQEISRKTGLHRVPKYTITGSRTIWWNIDIVYLQDRIEDSATFYVIDNFNGYRDEFIIKPSLSSAGQG